MKTQGVILTGDRPTGPLHVGHYIGSLINRKKCNLPCCGYSGQGQHPSMWTVLTTSWLLTPFISHRFNR